MRAHQRPLGAHADLRLASSQILLRALLLLIVPAIVLASPGSAGAQVDGDDSPVYVMRIAGTIDLGLAPYVDRVVAAADDAAAIIIVIDTPGGPPLAV